MTHRGWRSLAQTTRNWLIQKDGPLTRELVQSPARFGLGRLPQALHADQTANLVCGFCSTGCGLTIHLKEGQAVGLSPTRRYPVNLGMACPKGWEALSPLGGSTRAMTPLLRRGQRLEPATWQDALTTMTERLRQIQARHGAHAVAWLGTGQLPTEELAYLGALGKFGMGMLHGDGNTRQCMATAAVAYKQSFGFDAPPFTYQDFEQSDVIVLVGANPCIAHPIMWQRICRNPHSPKIVVIDPRATETAMAATHHYALRPKSDLSLLYAVCRQIVARDEHDARFVREHTDGFDDFVQRIQPFTLERAAEDTGLEAARIAELAALVAGGERVSFWWTMGVNQSHQGVRTAQAIIALALITGNIGRPGTGANSITGQCNAMGSRLFSNTTNLLGGREFTDAEQRAEVASILGIPQERIPSQNSWSYDRIIEGILAGKIRALWVIGTNPAHSWINQAHLQEVLERLDCLIVQDMYCDTETAQRADILLPAAGWGEKEGTFINSERRIGLIHRISVPPGEALADFHIFQLLAEAWGCDAWFHRWSSPQAVFELLQRLSAGRPCDFSGIEGYEHLARAGGIQWPLPRGVELQQTERRLFTDGRFFTPNGRARLFFTEPRSLPEETSSRFPLLLLTGRGSSSQWHTQTRTKHSEVLRQLSPSEVYVAISPVDARALGVRPDDWVRITSQRSAVEARAFVSHTVQPGQVFMPMHFPETNQLTFPAFDPHSRQPAYKASAVRVERVTPH